MRGVSQLGDWPAHVSLGLVLLVLAYWRRSKKWMRIAAAMILACALAGAVARVVKISTGRARPSVQTEAAWSGPSFKARYNAFPSGHTAASTAFFATLALASWRIGVPFLAIPLLIAFSRMYVGRTSPVRCGLRGVDWDCCPHFAVAQWILAEFGIRNPKPEVERRRASRPTRARIRSPIIEHEHEHEHDYEIERRGWDSNPRGLAPCRFSRPEPSTARPPLRGSEYRAVRNCANANTPLLPSSQCRTASGRRTRSARQRNMFM